MYKNTQSTSLSKEASTTSLILGSRWITHWEQERYPPSLTPPTKGDTMPLAPDQNNNPTLLHIGWHSAYHLSFQCLNKPLIPHAYKRVLRIMNHPTQPSYFLFVASKAINIRLPTSIWGARPPILIFVWFQFYFSKLTKSHNLIERNEIKWL